jgi:hypothetical protein
MTNQDAFAPHIDELMGPQGSCDDDAQTRGFQGVRTVRIVHVLETHERHDPNAGPERLGTVPNRSERLERSDPNDSNEPNALYLQEAFSVRL